MKKTLEVLDYAKGPAIWVAGSVASTVLPTKWGYDQGEKSQKTKNLGRAASIGLGAGISAIALNPRMSLPRVARGALLKKVGPKKYKNLQKYLPAMGAIWGGSSGLASYESGRLAKQHMEKKAATKAQLAEVALNEKEVQKILDILLKNGYPDKTKSKKSSI